MKGLRDQEDYKGELFALENIFRHILIAHGCLHSVKKKKKKQKRKGGRKLGSKVSLEIKREILSEMQKQIRFNGMSSFMKIAKQK